MIRPVEITPFQLAQKFMGIAEKPGAAHESVVLAFLQRAAKWVMDDETAWCGAFAGGICWLLDCEYTDSLSARAWLTIGERATLETAMPGFDLVVLSRPPNPAHGHVGFYAGHSMATVQILGGNQRNRVGIDAFDRNRILDIRRVRPRRRASDAPHHFKA